MVTLRRIWLNGWGRCAGTSRSARKHRERLAACCTDVIVNLNDVGDTSFRMFKTLSEYAAAFEHFRELGVRVHVMSWVRPDPEWIDTMARELARLRECAPFDTALLDAEGAWSRGWTGRRPADRAVREGLWQACAARVNAQMEWHSVPWGASDVPMVDWDVFGPLAEQPGCLYVMPQAHEFGLRTGWRKPGVLVAWVYSRPRWAGHRNCIPHLAAYGLTQTAKGLRKSVEAAVDCGATEIAAWTAKRFRSRGLRKVLREYKDAIDVDQAIWGDV